MKRRRIPVIGVIILIVVIAAGGAILYWKTHKKKIIRAQVEKAINEKSGGLYKVHYDNLELDEVGGHLSISSFSLTYDSIKFAALKRQHKEPYLLFNITVPVDKEISGRHLTLLNPVIEILYTNTGKDSLRKGPDREIYQQILGDLNLIKIDSVVISGATVVTKSLRSGKTFVEFTNLSISLLHLAVDSVANADTTRLLFAKEVNLDCEKFSWQSHNKLYYYQIDDMAFRSAISNVSIRSFYMKPQLKEDDFVRKFPYQVDRFDFALHNIQLKNTDFYQLIGEVIKADTLLIGSASFKIYRDRNIPGSKKSRVGAYPHQLIQKIPVEIDIRKAIIRNTDIEYKEKSTVTHQSGKVQFGNSSAYVSNITNSKERIAHNNRLVLDMRSLFLNKIPLTAKWTFILGDRSGRFRLQGKSGQADATLFNPIAVPMGPARLKSGHISSLEYDLAGTNYKMTGIVKLLYTDFKIALLRKDDDSVHYKKKKLASLFANFKIENANPDGNEKPRVAHVTLQRDIHRSMFNLAWKSLFEGVSEITNAK